jgi:hypothetical protein
MSIPPVFATWLLCPELGFDEWERRILILSAPPLLHHSVPAQSRAEGREATVAMAIRVTDLLAGCADTSVI